MGSVGDCPAFVNIWQAPLWVLYDVFGVSPVTSSHLRRVKLTQEPITLGVAIFEVTFSLISLEEKQHKRKIAI